MDKEDQCAHRFWLYWNPKDTKYNKVAKEKAERQSSNERRKTRKSCHSCGTGSKRKCYRMFKTV